MKIASTLAWVFPGAGHYYSGRVGKGVLFTSLELISIAAIMGSSAEFSTADKRYQYAMLSMTWDDGLPYNCSEMGEELELVDCYNYWKSEAEIELKRKNIAQVSRIVASTTAVGIWLWNTRDVKKNRRSNYSHNSKFSVGVNRYGQVEVRINF